MTDTHRPISRSTSPMPLSASVQDNRQDDKKGLMLPPPLPIKEKDGQSGSPAPAPRMTRLPSLKQLSDHLHYTPTTTSSSQLPNPLATPDRSTIPATPPSSLRISTHPSAISQTPNGSSSVSASPIIAPSPSTRLKLPASAMMRSMSSGGGAGQILPTINSSPITSQFGSVQSPATATADMFAQGSSSHPLTPNRSGTGGAATPVSMSRSASRDANGYIEGYSNVPSLDQIRRRVSVSRAMSFSGNSPGSGSVNGGITGLSPGAVIDASTTSSPANAAEKTAKDEGPKAPRETEDKKVVQEIKEKEKPVDSSPDAAGSVTSASDQSVAPPNGKKKEHPLQHAWTLYFDSKTYKPPAPQTTKDDKSVLADYEMTLVTVGKFDTVEGFARHLNNVRLPSSLAKNSNYHMFKNGIRPMWEDPANANGGKWVVLFRSSPPTLDVAWANLTMALVGEILDPEDQVSGIVASNRPKIDRIQIWTRGRDDVDAMNNLGKRILDIMGLEGRDAECMSMEYQYNATNSNPPPNKFLHIPFPTRSSTPLSTPTPNRLSVSGAFQGPPSSHLSISPSPRSMSNSTFPPPKSPTTPTGQKLEPPNNGHGPASFRGRLGSGSGGSKPNAFSGPMGSMAMGRIGSSSSLRKEAAQSVVVGTGGGA
nr:uncharacterized protein CI109_003030 [Kwoniella shandongensis]KAA5528498.1 hypothetical protein CI109_003030 [Kwoniella shandongensis]